MRNMLFLAIGCLSGCVLIVNQRPGEHPHVPDTRISLTLHQAFTTPRYPDAPRPPPVEPPTVVVNNPAPLPVPPAVLPIPAAPSKTSCPLFLLPVKLTMPPEVNFSDPKLKNKEDVEDALIAYTLALEKYIETERARLSAAYRAYLIKCEPLNIKN